MLKHTSAAFFSCQGSARGSVGREGAARAIHCWPKQPPGAFGRHSCRLLTPGGRGLDFADHQPDGHTGRRSVPSGVREIHPCKPEFRARRKPRLLLRFDGLFLLRFADRQFLAVLFQLPPRLTRFEPYGSPTGRVSNTLWRNRQVLASAAKVKAVAASSLDCRSR